MGFYIHARLFVGNIVMSFGLEQKCLKYYILGFGLSILLTSISFSVVMLLNLTHDIIKIIIIFSAIAQVIVHFVFFLNIKSFVKSMSWLALTYTFILIFILVGASIWIMGHLNHRMMSHEPPYMDNHYPSP